MKLQIFFLVVVLWSVCSAGNVQKFKKVKKAAGGHGQIKRAIGDFLVGVFWPECPQPRLGVSMYEIRSSPAGIWVTVTRLSNNAVIADRTGLSVEAGAIVSETFEVPTSGEAYLVEWEDQSDASNVGSVTLHACSGASGAKDPHMRTFSGVKYNFQGYCTYTLAKDCRTSRPAFNIYADFRGRDNPTKPPTRMVAVTTQVFGGDAYTFLEDHSVLVNNRPITDRNLTIGDEIGYIQEGDGNIRLYLRDAELSLEWNGKDHAASVTIGSDEFEGRLCGMFGSGGQVKGKDLIKSDGTLTYNTTEFAESWVVPGSCPY